MHIYCKKLTRGRFVRERGISTVYNVIDTVLVQNLLASFRYEYNFKFFPFSNQ